MGAPSHAQFLGQRPAIFAGAALLTTRGRAATLRQLLPLIVHQQAVVMPTRNGKIEQGLKEPVNVARSEKVPAPGHKRHAVLSIVQHDRQMVARRGILPHDHQIAKVAGVNLHTSGLLIAPNQSARFGHRLFNIQSPSDGSGRIEPFPLAGPRIDQAFLAPPRTGRFDLFAGAHARI